MQDITKPTNASSPDIQQTPQGGAEKLAAEEFAYIRARRLKAYAGQECQPQDIPTAHDEEPDRVGLAFSGGGIRSATFALGILQGLAELKVLKAVDYLSTVSGGGYIGSWFAAWVKREGDPENVRKQLCPDRTEQADAVRGVNPADTTTQIPERPPRASEPEPIFHLREFSNYLSPRLSFFSGDTWALVSTYLRNLLANQVILLSLGASIILLIRLLVSYFSYNGEITPQSTWGSRAVITYVISTICGVVVPLIATFKISHAVLKLNQNVPPAQQPGLTGIVVMMVIWALGFAWMLLPGRHEGHPSFFLDFVEWVVPWLKGMGYSQVQKSHFLDMSKFSILQMSVCAIVLGMTHGLIGCLGRQPWRKNGWQIVCGFLSGAVGGALLYAVVYALFPQVAPDDPRWAADLTFRPESRAPSFVVTLAPPLLLLAFVFAIYSEVALCGRRTSEQEREWWSRLSASLLLVAFCWTVVFGLSLYGALWFLQIEHWSKGVLASGWIMSAIGGVAAARSEKTDGKSGNVLLERVGALAPFVFLIGLVCCMSLVVSLILDSPPKAEELAKLKSSIAEIQRPQSLVNEVTRTTVVLPEKKSVDEKHVQRYEVTTDEMAIRSRVYWWGLENVAPQKLCWWCVGLIALTLLSARRVDVNEFSLNAMYANRLARCYLGASRRKPASVLAGVASGSRSTERSPHPVTGFDPDDDLPLTSLRIGVPDPEGKEPTYWGPFPLINTALNLVAGEQLAWQERKAESFVLTPLCCGANALGYRDTLEYASDEGDNPLTLGRAVSISGAAANPNMGYNSSPAAAALMTFFNVRLGWWLPNPLLDKWRSSGPKWGLEYLLYELFGMTNDKCPYVNISDGGHFENLGVYELIRRRCRYVIVSDAGADPKFEYEDLGGLIRRCRTDFGVDIEIDVSPLRPDANSKKSRWHCVIGTIRYDQIDPALPVGTLVYIKPTLSGDESADVLHYANQHPDFPHQPTLDQFFNESQFESYRSLGYHCALEVFESSIKKLKLDTEKKPAVSATKLELNRFAEDEHHNYVENLFYQLRKTWLAPITDIDQSFMEANEGFSQFQEVLRDDSLSQRISTDIYPELSQLPLEDLRDFHTAMLMVQVLENAFVSMKMDRFHSHPLNSGWMNTSQRWSNSRTVQRFWPLLRNEFSRDFVQFCEEELALKLDTNHEWEFYEDLVRTDQGKAEWAQLVREHAREWPDEIERKRGLDLLLADPPTYQDSDRGPSKACWVWRVRMPQGVLDDQDPLKTGFVAGVIGLRRLKGVEIRTFHEMEAGSNGVAPALDRAGYELVVWVRPAFRQKGVGIALVQSFNKKLFDDDSLANDLLTASGSERCKSIRIAVLYPKTGWNGVGDALDKSLWMSYFTYYGFRSPDRDWPQAPGYEVLKYDRHIRPQQSTEGDRPQ